MSLDPFFFHGKMISQNLIILTLDSHGTCKHACRGSGVLISILLYFNASLRLKIKVQKWTPALICGQGIVIIIFYYRLQLSNRLRH